MSVGETVFEHSYGAYVMMMKRLEIAFYLNYLHELIGLVGLKLFNILVQCWFCFSVAVYVFEG